MIRNIVFGGCSFTWGQSLHYHANFDDDIHPRDGLFYKDLIKNRHYQYMVDNRFSTRVADYFGRKPKVWAINGGDNCSICRNVLELIDENTDCIIIQTTSIHRCMEPEIDRPSDFNGQMECFLNIIREYEPKGIIVRFIHFDLEFENVPKEIFDRTIKIKNQPTFYDLLMQDDSKYTIKHTFNCLDSHFNMDGHILITNHLIKHLSKYLEIPKYKTKTTI
jgi:hypothetical protein